MFRFLMNLFNLGKNKKEEDFLEVEVDKENGRMVIKTNRELSPKEIMDILEEHLGDEDGNV